MMLIYLLYKNYRLDANNQLIIEDVYKTEKVYVVLLQKSKKSKVLCHTKATVKKTS